jgi:lipopolysaccharide/colanic/teichoic acid biosynthesis glycosyltransferase
LVPALLAKGAKLLLVGRDVHRLKEMYPFADVCDYDAISVAGRDFDALLHLAVLNNNSSASAEEYVRVNVDLALKTLVAAKQAGIRRFIDISSFHALDHNNLRPYAQSKRLASKQLFQADTHRVVTIYLPAVVGGHLSGKLAVLNRLPMRLRTSVLVLLAALRPTVSLGRVTEVIWHLSKPDAHVKREYFVADDQAKNPIYCFLNRSIDLVFSLVVIVLFAWLLLIIWIIVRLQSEGPGFFRQQRVGKDRRTFICYKFRTMDVRAPNVGSHEVPTSVITPVGRFLRRTKLDELPQAVNILLNQMSLVGPRPCLPSQDQVIAERNKLGVFDIKPGITGMAQVRDVDMSTPELLAEWDARYMATRSIMSDFQIILATVRGKGRGDAAGRRD